MARKDIEKAEGFSILETLIAVVILTTSIGGLAVLSARQWSRSTDIDVLDRVENAVAADLGWLKSYAKYWRMSSGPYDLCPTGFNYSANNNTCSVPDTGANSTNSPRSGASVFTRTLTTVNYEPDRTDLNEARCSTTTGLAQAFLNDASANATQTLFTPNRPYALSTAAPVTLLSNTQLPFNLSLRRTIAFTRANGSVNNTLYITYLLDDGQGSPATSPYRFQREVALRPDAADWCP